MYDSLNFLYSHPLQGEGSMLDRDVSTVQRFITAATKGSSYSSALSLVRASWSLYMYIHIYFIYVYSSIYENIMILFDVWPTEPLTTEYICTAFPGHMNIYWKPIQKNTSSGTPYPQVHKLKYPYLSHCIFCSNCTCLNRNISCLSYHLDYHKYSDKHLPDPRSLIRTLLNAAIVPCLCPCRGDAVLRPRCTFVGCVL